MSQPIKGKGGDLVFFFKNHKLGGFNLFLALLGITFIKIPCLARDHWRGLSARDAHVVHIVNYIRIKMVYTDK